MTTKAIITLLFEFGYVLIFGIMGAASFLLHIPKDKGMESYKKARTSLGAALLTLSLFCIIKILILNTHTEYVDFWLLVTFTLIHSWLTYATMLFLLETPRFLIKHFLVDGIVPTVTMLICGIIGLIYPASQRFMQIVFGCIFGLKCTYMFYICLHEYYKCERELTEYYDQTPNIVWIKRLIYLSIFMSAATLVSFYVTYIHAVYYILIPIIYAYIFVKIINFAPKKIDEIRKQNILMEKEEKKEEKEKKKNSDLGDKIRPLVESWIEDRGYCTPELNIKSVAAEIGTNQNYLSQYINNYLDTTFQVWLNTLRIEEAKQILKNGEKLSIEEVGAMVGFPQSYNFSKWFRTVTGTTPYKFRKYS